MATVICPRCSAVNPHGVLFCNKCYALLMDTVRVSGQMSAPKVKTPRLLTQRQSERQVEADQLPGYMLSLYLDAARTPLLLPLRTTVIIGRGKATDDQMQLDFTPYGATEAGVSRRHLIFKRIAPASITVADMGSSNGTWLDDVALQPYYPVPLTSGSTLRLGRFLLEVYMAS